jgi:hypothetical protein
MLDTLALQGAIVNRFVMKGTVLPLEVQDLTEEKPELTSLKSDSDWSSITGSIPVSNIDTGDDSTAFLNLLTWAFRGFSATKEL